jgi:acetate kinase
MNKHSGLSGISGLASDMREIIEAMRDGHTNAELAFDIYCYRLKKYIGAYAAAMGGLDRLVFTAGVGENSPEVRQKTCEGLEFIGLMLDREKNSEAVGKEMIISTDDSPAKIIVVPTNEELVIARDTMKLINKGEFGNN